MTPSRHHRFDQDVHARRARARAHLARIRGSRDEGGHSEARPRVVFRTGRLGVLVIGAAALLGLTLGDDLLLRTSGARDPLASIEVRGATRLSPSQVAAATGLEPGVALDAVDVDGVVEALESHDWIHSARALKLPGGTLLVDVNEREPVATVALRKQLYAVDPDGEAFASLEEGELAELVRIVLERDDLEPGEPDPRLATAARLARRLPELGLAAPREVTIAAEDDPRGYGLRLAALPAQVVLGHGELDERLDALARLVSARPDVVATATSIDLRFADQVVLRGAPAQEGSANQASGRGDVRTRNLQPTG